LRDRLAQDGPVLLRLGIAIFIGMGAGMLAAGVALGTTSHRSDAPPFLGLGVGALTVAGMAYSLLCSFATVRWWRVVIALFFGLGVGMLVGGIAVATFGSYNDAPPFMAVGSGLLACGGMIWLQFFGPVQADPRRWQLRLSDVSSWRSSMSQWGGSLRARPWLLVFCLVLAVLTGLLARALGFGLSLLVVLAFCAWGCVWRARLPREGGQPAQAPAPEQRAP
jgi:hypothetical protein